LIGRLDVAYEALNASAELQRARTLDLSNNLLVHTVEKYHGSGGVLQPEVVYSEEEFKALYNAAKHL
jgi:hypothetical protein